MNRRTLLATIALTALAAATVRAATNAAPDPARFAKEIEKMAAADAAQPPPSNAVLFVGSSSIRMWKNLAADMKGHVALNRGFGGAQVPDVLHYFDVVVKPPAPRAIVFYCGENDIASSRSPGQVRDDFVEFVRRARAVSPGVPIACLSMKPSPKRWALWDKISAGNRLVAEACAAGTGLTFLDVGKPMLGADGVPRPELFLADRLHMNETGYAIWTKIVRDYLAALPAPSAPKP